MASLGNPFPGQATVQGTKCARFASMNTSFCKLCPCTPSVSASRESPAASPSCPHGSLYSQPGLLRESVPPLAQGFVFVFVGLCEVPVSSFLQLSLTVGQLPLLAWDQPAMIFQRDRNAGQENGG